MCTTSACMTNCLHERFGPARRHAGAGLFAALHPRSDGLAQRLSRTAGHPRVLPGRLESRLRRSDGALQRDPQRIPPVQRRAHRHLGGRHLVSSGVCGESEAALSAARRFRAQGRRRPPVRRVSRPRRDQRARALRHRCRTASSVGATCHPSGSIPAPTAFCARSRRCNRGQAMAAERRSRAASRAP